MASGNFISNTGVNLNLYITWSSTINVAGNYSDVLMTAYLRHSALTVGARATQPLVVEGTTQYYNASAISYSSSTVIDTQIGQTTIRVYHNSDGTMPSCDLYGSYYFGGTYGGKSIGTITASTVVVLDTIPRRSTIWSLNGTIEVNGTNDTDLIITRADASFTHTVTYSIGSYSQQFTGVATTQTFAIPLAWLNAIPSSISGTANCRVETFSGATSLGYVDGAFTITVPSTIIPVVTNITHARDTTGTDSFTTYAKGVSKVSVSGITVTNQYSATTASYKTYLHLSTDTYTLGTLYTGASFISDAILLSGTMRLTTIVTDSRGRDSVAYYEDFTVYDYFAPSLTVSAFRCNAAGVADPAGEYLSATMTANVAPVNNDNTHTYVFEFKKTTDSTWTAISTSALSGYSGTLNAVRSASSSFTWEVRASITDKVSTATKTATVVSKRVPINCGHSGTAVAIGKVAETADLFEVDLAAKFNKAVTITGALTAPVATSLADGLQEKTDKALFDEARWKKYITATAGSNGDFHITLLGTLATNDIVYINFPAATNGASNARLSVDGGTSYKNIKWSSIRIASEVASKRLSFVYDGTDFVPLETQVFPITYTPTVWASAGTITTYTATARYIKVGNVMHLAVQIDITNKGTATGSIFFNLPYLCPIMTTGACVEFTGTGHGGYMLIRPNEYTGQIAKYDSTTFLVNGYSVRGSVTYVTA